MALPERTVVLVNHDFATRASEPSASGLRALEADSGVLDSARAITAALRSVGVEVEELAVTSSLAGVADALRARGVTTVFNLVESIDNDYGREWQVPALLDKHAVRYTGNGPRPLRLARTKDVARRVLERAGVRVPQGLVVRDRSALTTLRAKRVLYPCFVKPARVDGSIGIDRSSICSDERALVARLDALASSLPGPYLIEEYLPGKEINVALFPEPERGHVVATEIDFSGVPADIPRIITYDAKWNPASPEYASRSVPAVLAPALRSEVEALARAAFAALGGTSYGRVDMRLDAHGEPAVIDVNPNNDLGPDAGLSAAARSVGVDYEALIASILEHAHGGRT